MGRGSWRLRHVEGTGGGGGQSVGCGLQGVTAAIIVQSQVAESRHSIDGCCGQGPSQRAAAGVAPQVQRNAAVVSRINRAVRVLDGDGHPKGVTGLYGAGRLGNDVQFGRVAVTNQAGNELVGDRRADAGHLVVAGAGA